MANNVLNNTNAGGSHKIVLDPPTSKGTTKSIISLRHPLYNEKVTEWEKFRLTYAGGRPFIEKYLKSFSKREDGTEFNARKDSSYCPAHAKTAVNEIKDAVSERLVDVVRTGGSPSYQKAIIGGNGGVDKDNSTMNGFIGSEVLPELLSMGKVGVYVDRGTLPERASKTDVSSITPYLYTFTAEDIFAWDYTNGVLTTVLLREQVFTRDAVTELPAGLESAYRLLKLTDSGVTVQTFNKDGKESTMMTTLNLQTIPFTLFEISESILTDIADYQIALLNLGSSDLAYAIKSNFPFYVEQFDPRDLVTNLLRSGTPSNDGTDTDPGSSADSNTARDNEMRIGTGQGRRYPKGVDSPGFINPSPEPLTVSMQKQKDLQVEIKELARLSVKGMSGEEESSEESGLATIGGVLEKGERAIADIWASYEHTDPAMVKYPENYTLRTDAERRDEADKLMELMPKLPSNGLKKTVSKQVAHILVGHRVSFDEMKKIYAEIDKAEVIITDPEVIREDLEAGLVSTELASKLRNYPEGEVEQAKIDHADRLYRIAIAQSKAAIDDSGLNGARGVKDFDSEDDTAKLEKKESRDTTQDDTVGDKTRGKGVSNE